MSKHNSTAPTYPPVKIELAPPAEGDPCPYIAHPLPRVFVAAIAHGCACEIEAWLAKNAPPYIQELISAQHLAEEYQTDLDKNRPIAAFLHTGLLSKLPTTLAQLERQITYDVGGLLFGDDQ